MAVTISPTSGITTHVSYSRRFAVIDVELSLALGHDKAQNIIDQITSAYESSGGPPPGGFSFNPPAYSMPPPMSFGGPPGGPGGPFPPGLS
jgi:hypothetical protein